MNRDIGKELSPFFNPRGVALIGASGTPGKVGHLYMSRFRESGFENIYPINLKEDKILGVKAYPNIKDVPDPVDQAIILLPPGAVTQAVKDCVTKGVKGIIINSAGFGEEGNEGLSRQNELVRLAREGGSRILGPNCIGVYCPAAKLPFPQGPAIEEGKVGIISQSGSLADHLTLIATTAGIRFSKAISVGNQSDLKVIDFFEYLGEDPDTEIILAYLEGIEEGRRFHDLAAKISKKKPIIIWKCGASEAGARAASSHTGAMAGSSRVWEGVLKGDGIISVDSVEEMLDVVYVFHNCPLPKGNNVALITASGGPAAGTTDGCIRMGLVVPDLSNETKEKILKVIPLVGTSVKNPIDLSMVGWLAPEMYRETIKILGEDENIHMIIAIGSGSSDDFYNSILEAVKVVHKPVVTSLLLPPEVLIEGYQKLLVKGIPLYPDPVRAARALSRLSEYAVFLRNQET